MKKNKAKKVDRKVKKSELNPSGILLETLKNSSSRMDVLKAYASRSCEKGEKSDEEFFALLNILKEKDVVVY